jgi:class 3 adenylate cyclase/predicted ATPase
MRQVSDWLAALGLAQYAECFAENDIDFAVLRDLTDQDLEKIGVLSLGHRRKILRAIAELAGVPAPQHVSAEAKPHDAAERRQVTVMFTDLVGSTALSARMDPEDLRVVIGAYHKCVADTVARFEGFLAKYMGDGVLVYFGYPQAHEDDAERAVRAGLALIDDVASLTSNEPLKVRVGVATGLVVVGDLVGSGEAQERGIVGETPNLAARLQAIAEPNMLVIADSTRRLLGNLFELQDLGQSELKGVIGQVRTWAALRTSSVESRFEALHASTLTALVGREEELELLMRRWSRAKTGEGQVVLLSGEPGIGKSRLTAELMERLAPEPHTRLRYFCSPQHADSALYPIIGQMERAAGFEREDTPQAKLEKLTSLLDSSSAPANDMQLLSELLSISTGDCYAPLNLSPQLKKQKTFEALVRQLQTLSRNWPVLVIYEDAQWIDPSSLELLDMIVDRVAILPVLLIITFRPEFQPPWTGQADVSTINLSRLRRREGAELIGRVAGNIALPGDIVAEIVERTDGIPLFVEELTKAVLEAGLHLQDSARSVSTAPRAAFAVPMTLQASLMARLDRLGPAARETAQIGAAIGREFSYELIAAVGDRSEDELRSSLDQLVNAGLVFRRGSPPEATFLFKHALVQDAAYGTLLKGPRQHLHMRIARMVEERLPDRASSHPELVAGHYSQAGLIEQAIEFWNKAGHLAVRRSTMLEAVVHFGNALKLLAGLPESEQRRARELALQLDLAGTLMTVKGWASPQVGDAYSRARELCREGPDGSQLANALGGTWAYLLNRADMRGAHQIAAELVALSERRNDRATKLMAHRSLATTCLFRGQFSSVLEQFGWALTFYRWAEHKPPVLAPYDIRVTCESIRAWALLILGLADQAVEHSRHALAYARELSLPYTLAFALHTNCVFHQLRGDWQELRERSQELVALATEQRFPHFVGTGRCFRGWAKVANGGSIEEAIDEMRRGLAAKRATGAEIKVPYYFCLLADAHRRANRTNEGLVLLSEALSLIDQTDERWFEAEVHRLRGEMLIASGDRDGAEPCFSRALEIARQQQAKSWELRAAMSMARLWRDQGKRDEARNLLAPIYGWFTEGFDTLDLKQAKALLEEL